VREQKRKQDTIAKIKEMAGAAGISILVIANGAGRHISRKPGRVLLAAASAY
jgi:hypothetical protein